MEVQLWNQDSLVLAPILSLTNYEVLVNHFTDLCLSFLTCDRSELAVKVLSSFVI